MRRRSITRRILWRAALASPLAAFTVCALCWLAPQFAGMPAIRGAGPGVPGTFWVDDSHGGHWIASRAWSWQSLDLRRIIFRGSPRDQSYYGMNEPPPWARRLSIDGREGFEEVLTVATGWPWRATTWERWIRWQAPEPVIQLTKGADGTLQVQSTTAPNEEQRDSIDFERWGRRWILPTRVLWSGLIANFALAWFAWALLLAGPVAIHATVRRLRNRCVSCGYSRHGALASTACPECGAPLNRDAPARAPHA